jgi:hypothetical protein
MSESVWASIEIGGNIPADKLDEFAQALSNEMFDEGGPDENTEDAWIQHIKDTAAEGSTLELTDSSASWGEFADLEKWLLKNDITFVRQSEAFGEYNGEYIWHVQGKGDATGYATKAFDGSHVLNRENVSHALTVLQNIPTLEEAALQANEDGVQGIIAKEALRIGEINPVHLLRHWLDEYCPNPPSVPALTIM